MIFKRRIINRNKAIGKGVTPGDCVKDSVVLKRDYPYFKPAQAAIANK